MRIFLTGATGYIGAAVLDALVRGGHDVTALVRNTEKARRVAKRGGHPVIGDLADPESYRAAAAAQDGYIHAAFDARPERTATIDRLVVDTILEAAVAGGLGKRARRRHSRRHARLYCDRRNVLAVRSVGRALGRDLLHRLCRQKRRGGEPARHLCLQRRPGVVYGRGSGIVGDLFKSASNGLVRVVGDGNNHWPLVYDRDLADLYARLVAREDAGGVYHANDEGDERVNDIVSAIKPHLAVRPDVRHVPIDEARHKMGTYADALMLDQVVRSPRARALGWTPSLHSVAGNAARLLEEWRAERN